MNYPDNIEAVVQHIGQEIGLEPAYLYSLGPDECFEEVMRALKEFKPRGLAWIYAVVLMDMEGGNLMHATDGSPEARADIAKRRLQGTLKRAEAEKSEK